MTIHPLNLAPQEMTQQLDAARRLLHMAMLGVPNKARRGNSEQERLALHALMTAYVALAKSSPQACEEALELAAEANGALLATKQRKDQRGSAPHIGRL